MTPQEIESLYMLHSENVRHLALVISSLNREINRLIERSENQQISIRTKILALVYSAWSEAQFLQILHSPRGLMYTEIETVKKEKDKNGIGAGWKIMLEKAISRVGDPQLNRDLGNRLSELLTITKEYIEEPSIIRNKIAHGQWIKAFNRDNTAENEEKTREISNLDPVAIMKRRQIHQYFGFIVRDLMQSPQNGFHRHYWTNIVLLEKFISRSRGWTLASKSLKIKRSDRKPGTCPLCRSEVPSRRS